MTAKAAESFAATFTPLTGNMDGRVPACREDKAMAMLQLNPPLPMNTPKGEGLAHLLIDYGPESDLYWTVFLTATGEIWTFANRHVRAAKNITLDRTHPSQPPGGLHGPVPMRPAG